MLHYKLGTKLHLVCTPFVAMNKRYRQVVEMDQSMDTARVLMLLKQDGAGGVYDEADADTRLRTTSRLMHSRVFECKTCNRQFPTFQALGGHRASHKRPRLALDSVELCLGRPPPAKPRVHECPICGLEFTIGQALGGHMRRHRAGTDVHAASTVKAEGGGGLCLDLNLTPSENCAKCRKAGIGAAEQGVLEAFAILDCSV